MGKIKISILFIFLISIYNCIIIIPFTEYIRKEPDNFTFEDVIKFWEPNIIYSNISIGTPPQKIIIIINSQNYGINLYQNMCNFTGSSYLKNKSSTFNIDRIINNYSPKYNVSIINETLYFYDNVKLKRQKPFENMKLIYSDNEDKAQKDFYTNTCINVGLQLDIMYYHEYPINLINQLKKNYQIIETYDFSFKYKSENKGEIIIGAEPHIYDAKNYFEPQFRRAGAIEKNKENIRDWFLNFDKIYYTYKVKSTGRIINETIGLVKSLRIQFDKGMIIGPFEYKEMIKRHFFNDLIKEKKCFETTVENDKEIFYCDKSAENNIKDDFPTLYFEMKQFYKIFELNYRDLFREKNGKFYFLIYFQYYANYFTVGKIFLKKYFFTFNQDSKAIGFYNEELPGGEENKNKDDNLLSNTTLVYFIIIIILLIIIFVFLGFYVGKLIYNKVRKKRINELDDNYEYNTQDNLNNNENEDDDKLYINEN